MNHRAVPVLLAALLIVCGLVATVVARGGEFGTLVGAGIGALLFIAVGTAVAVARA